MLNSTKNIKLEKYFVKKKLEIKVEDMCQRRNDSLRLKCGAQHFMALRLNSRDQKKEEVHTKII